MERPHAQSSARKLISDESLWTSTIPAPLALYQYLEELPMTCAPAEYEDHLSRFPHITSVPLPPTLPRILDKVILNSESRRSWDEPPTSSPGLDDNSILPVPNHVVLNHLTASAIKNGTLGVGTTTRYRKKVSRRFAMAPPSGGGRAVVLVAMALRCQGEAVVLRRDGAGQMERLERMQGRSTGD